VDSDIYGLSMFLTVYVCHRLHAQALTLAALAGAAIVEYYDHQYDTASKSDRHSKQFLSHSHKDH
jgi:hypothetical protein